MIQRRTVLCQNDDEAEALGDAIIPQSTEPWEFKAGDGGAVSFPLPGVLVVRNTEQGQHDVQQLLENYRLALRSSRQRAPEGPDPDELFTHYYRLPAEIAAEMAKHLPQLIQPTSWKSADRPDASGSILKLASAIQLVDSNGFSIMHREPNDKNAGRSAVLVEYSVLVIHQTRATHQEISRLLSRVQPGDPPLDAEGNRQTSGVGMSGMGGIGGGASGSMVGMSFGG